jgi:glycyl-tRNA synthetase
MELEYFVHPDKYGDCPFIDELMDYRMNVFSAEMQANKEKMKKLEVKDALDKGMIKTKWHAYWMVQLHRWYVSLGAKAHHFRIRQHVKDELSHYALDTWDLEYEFPFGWKELQGFSNRTDFDLKQHMEHSKADLSLFDEETKKKVIPHVICEPSQGVGRAFLVFMFDAYSYDKERENVVLKLHPKLAPIKFGVFPLVSNKPEIMEKAKEVHEMLKCCWTTTFDKSGSIGRRYARADETGVVACITIDFASLKDNCVTIRDRDTMKQERVKISELRSKVKELMN